MGGVPNQESRLAGARGRVARLARSCFSRLAAAPIAEASSPTSDVYHPVCWGLGPRQTGAHLVARRTTGTSSPPSPATSAGQLPLAVRALNMGRRPMATSDQAKIPVVARPPGRA